MSPTLKGIKQALHEESDHTLGQVEMYLRRLRKERLTAERAAALSEDLALRARIDQLLYLAYSEGALANLPTDALAQLVQRAHTVLARRGRAA